MESLLIRRRQHNDFTAGKLFEFSVTTCIEILLSLPYCPYCEVYALCPPTLSSCLVLVFVTKSKFLLGVSTVDKVTTYVLKYFV